MQQQQSLSFVGKETPRPLCALPMYNMHDTLPRVKTQIPTLSAYNLRINTMEITEKEKEGRDKSRTVLFTHIFNPQGAT